MPEDKKIETADELLDLFNDLERLKDYRYSQPVVSDSGINNEKFHMELPYEAIKKIVEECRDKFLAAVPEEERSIVTWEHVGSTSIKGMPGTMIPDALVILPQYPPSKTIIQAFLDSGYYFSSSSALDLKNLRWFLVFTDGNNVGLEKVSLGNDNFLGRTVEGPQADGTRGPREQQISEHPVGHQGHV